LPSCPLALLRSCPLIITRRPFTSYLLPHVFHLQPLTSLLSPLIVCGLCYANSDVERTIYLTTESHKGVVTRATARRRFSPLAFHLSHLISDYPVLSLLCLPPHPPPTPTSGHTLFALSRPSAFTALRLSQPHILSPPFRNLPPFHSPPSSHRPPPFHSPPPSALLCTLAVLRRPNLYMLLGVKRTSLPRFVEYRGSLTRAGPKEKVRERKRARKYGHQAATYLSH
jgi:hypothetical protein